MLLEMNISSSHVQNTFFLQTLWYGNWRWLRGQISLGLSNVIYFVIISCRSFVFSESCAGSCAKVSAGFSNVSGDTIEYGDKLRSNENFIDAIKTIQMPDDHKLVSFDVKSPTAHQYSTWSTGSRINNFRIT